eukprot:Phypoly_transcript_08201.p1 GENE.Phypoly_transcript_08201~~Phypoly_transcript_08201.p1  ORF type:complete len:415 (+),score=85.91 Phypoly_transcript_08201:144-1388(+)
MSKVSESLILLLVVFISILCGCCASPPAITNLRLTAEYPSSSSVQYQLVWDPPISASAGHYRIRCLRGCEAYTSVQWDTHAPYSKVPTDILLKSVYVSTSDHTAKKGSFVLGVTHVYAHGEEGPSVNITLEIGTETKSHGVKKDTTEPVLLLRDDPTSLTTGPSSTTSDNTTTNTTSGGQLTSGSSSTTSSNNSTATTDQLTSGTSTTSTTTTPTPSPTPVPTSAPTYAPTPLPTSAPGSTTITITMTMSGDPSQFDTTQFGNALAESLGVSPDSVKVTVTPSRKRAGSFSVSAQVVYPLGSPHPDQSQVTAALNSSQVTDYLTTNSFTVEKVDVDIDEPTQAPTAPPATASTTSTNEKSAKHKTHIKGPIIAAIVVPVVVVLVAILIIVIMVRVRRRRWERRGIELEQIYKSF